MPNRRHTRRRVLILLVALAALHLAGCDDDPVTPAAHPTLDGYWMLNRNAGVWNVEGGGVSFAADGTFNLAGHVWTGDGGYETVEEVGSWARPSEGIVEITLHDRVTRWEPVFDAASVLLLEVGGDMRWFSLVRPMPD